MKTKQLFIKTAPSETKTFDLKNPNSIIELLEYESKIEQGNEVFIKTLEQDLEYYAEIISTSLKTQSKARELKKLVLSRQRVLNHSDDKTERFQRAIKDADFLIQSIDTVYQDLENEVNPYKGISKNLLEFISEMNDETFQYIVENKKLPEYTYPPKWEGNKADAVRLMRWLKMSYTPFNKCFYDADIKGSNSQGIKDESKLTEILKLYDL